MLDVRRLVVLREVASRGSLSAAAEALNYTPSAVSQQISVLEREVGQRLLERRGRGVVLTAAGHVLVEHTGRILDQLDAAEAALAELAELRRGQLRIASFATAGAAIVPRVVDVFRSRHPRIEVQVEQATSVDGITRLRRGQLDIVVTVDQDPAADVEIVPLFADPFRIALHRTHPRAGEAELHLADLAGERWIDVPPQTPGGGVLARAFKPLGIAHRVAHESDDYTAIHELVGAGLGVALVPDLALFPPNADVVIRSLGPDGPTRLVQAATRPAPLRSPAATAMLAILREYRPPQRHSAATPREAAEPREGAEEREGAQAQAEARSTPSRYVGT